MTQPQGFSDESKKVCKLKKALYGLKQASRVWNLKLDKVLRELGLERSKYDSCVYLKKTKDGVIYVAVYVDDLLIFYNCHSLLNLLMNRLNQKFKMKDLGVPKQVLGFRTIRTEEKLMLDQENFIQELLEKFNLADCVPVKTPFDPNQVLTKDMSPTNADQQKQMEKYPFKELVGSLQFLASGTRPDIAFAVNIVSAFNSNPGMPHWTAAKRILRYLKGTKELKLTYQKSEDPEFLGYSDSDYANDRDTRKSITGYVFTKAGGAVSWASKKQITVASSTTEAEYMALAAAAQEATW